MIRWLYVTHRNAENPENDSQRAIRADHMAPGSLWSTFAKCARHGDKLTLESAPDYYEVVCSDEEV